MALPVIPKDEWQQQPAAPEQQQQQATAPTNQFAPIPASAINIDEALPEYVNGLSHETPINESPLDFTQRFQLSAGQVGGSMTGTVKQLQDWGYEVKKNSKDDLVIKDPKDKLWKQYDAKDAWSSSRTIWGDLKEAGKDLADVIPGAIAGGVNTAVAGAFGTAAAVEAIGSGGLAAIPALATAAFGMTAGAAAGAATMTVMGKMMGTYRPDPNEDFSDLAKETMFGLAGNVIAAGVRPTAAIIGKGLSAIGEKIAPSLDNATLGLFSKVYGNLTGVGEEAMQYGLKDGGEGFKKTGALLASKELKGLSQEAMITELNKQQAEIASEVVPMARKVLTKIGQVESQKVLDAVDETIARGATNVPGLVAADMVVPAAVKIDGDVIYRNGLAPLAPFLTFTTKDGTKLAGLAAAFDHGIEKVTIGTAAKGANGEYLSEAGSKIVQNLVNDLEKFRGTGGSGSDAAKWAMGARREIQGALKSAGAKASDYTNPASELMPFIKQIREGVDAGIKAPLDQMSGGQYSNFLNIYRNSSQALESYTAAEARSVRAAFNPTGERMAAYSSLITKLNSRAGTNAFQKGTGDELTQLASQYAPGMVDAIKDHLGDIELRGVASKYVPWVRPGLVAQGAGVYGAGSLLAGNIGAAASSAGTVAATSPRLAQTIAPAALQTAKMVKAMAVAGGSKLLAASKTDPRALQQLIMMPLRAHEDQMQMHDQINGMMQQVVQTPTATSQGVNFQNPAELQKQQVQMQMKQQQQGR